MTAPDTSISFPATAAPAATPLAKAGGMVLTVGGVLLAAGLLLGPGPAIVEVHTATWLPGHLLNGLGFLLLSLSLPAVAGALGRRLGLLGAIGYAALMTRFILSTGSHLYSMWTLPVLAQHPDLSTSLTGSGTLASIYAGHGDVVGLVLAVGMLGLVYALWSRDRSLRLPAVVLCLAAISEALTNPLAILLFAVFGIWLGLRLAIRGDIANPLRGHH